MMAEYAAGALVRWRQWTHLAVLNSTMRSVERLLHSRVLWAVVPAELESRTLASLSVAPLPSAVVRHWPDHRPRRTTSKVRLAVAAVLVAGIGISTAVVAGYDAPATVALAGVAPGSSMNARAELHETGSGVQITLRSPSLPPAPAGQYYEGWVKGERGTVSIGTFHRRDGEDDIVLWSGVDLKQYPTIAVTLEREGAERRVPGRGVLSGVVPPADR